LSSTEAERDQSVDRAHGDADEQERRERGHAVDLERLRSFRSRRLAV
jgi:hypothetical protein